MSRVKNITINLLLAAAVATTLSINANNPAQAIQNDYSNNLLKVNLNKKADGVVDVSLFTSKPYTTKLNPIKHSDNEYVIVLPETYHSITAKPDYTSTNDSVKNVDVKLLPYVGGGANNGYTKITIKTAPNTVLRVNSQVVSQDNNEEKDIDNILAETKTVTKTKTQQTAVRKEPLALKKKIILPQTDKKVIATKHKPIIETQKAKVTKESTQPKTLEVAVEDKQLSNIKSKANIQESKPTTTVIKNNPIAVTTQPINKITQEPVNKAKQVVIPIQDEKTSWLSSQIQSIIENNLGNTFGIVLLSSVILLLIVLLKLFAKKSNEADPKNIFSNDFSRLNNLNSNEGNFFETQAFDSQNNNMHDNDSQDMDIEQVSFEEYMDSEEGQAEDFIFNEPIEQEEEQLEESSFEEYLNSEPEFKQDEKTLESLLYPELNNSELELFDDELPSDIPDEDTEDNFEMHDFVMNFEQEDLTEETNDILQQEALEPIATSETSTSEELAPQPVAVIEKPKEENLDVLYERALTQDKNLYLIDLEGEKALIGAVGENVSVLKRFDREIKQPKIAAKLNEKKENKELYLVQVENWRALVEVNNQDMKLALVL